MASEPAGRSFMQDDHRQDSALNSTLTRRRMVAAAAAGTVALASGPAAAQRCPAIPPARTKGQPVWLDLDQQDIDEAYDQSVYAFNAKNISDRQAENNRKALTILGKPQRVAYGAAEVEKLDIHKTRRANVPVMVFI